MSLPIKTLHHRRDVHNLRDLYHLQHHQRVGALQRATLRSFGARGERCEGVRPNGVSRPSGLLCSWRTEPFTNLLSSTPTSDHKVRNMRVPVYLVCAALVVAVNSEDHTNFFNGRFLEPIDVAADQETVSYLLPKLTAKYKPNSEWSGVTDPRFYVLTEMESNDIENQSKPNGESRSKRAGALGESGASLSIVNSLDVLRNRLLLEIARKKAKEGANRNRQILLSLGKRAFLQSRASGVYDNNV